MRILATAAASAADLTQVQLADALGISQPQLAFYELCKRPAQEAATAS